MTPTALIDELQAQLAGPTVDLARAALVVARVESPRLDPEKTMAAIDELGERAAERLAPLAGERLGDRVAALSRFLYTEAGFSGNREHYTDFRNSLLNSVIERRTGIPISLALVYREVADRAGIEVFGVSFPGHFLMRIPAGAGEEAPLILDPFDQGRRLDDHDCRTLLHRQLGSDEPFSPALLEPCTSRQFIARILNNLKRTYVEQRSFPQARAVTEMLLAVEPGVGADLRDRGLLAYHLNDFPTALQDLESYLRLRTWDARDKEERERIVEHINALRHRVAGFN
jgi:regulator of sirC expression with transglutaminase-like and TPR domain